MWRILRQLLFLLPPELAHQLGTFGLHFLLRLNRRPRKINAKSKRFRLLNHELFSPLGVAAGFDKDAKHILPLAQLGFGFVEIGSVTPLAQPGNPKPRLFRLPKSQALINRMGFNSEGVQIVTNRLQKIYPNRPCPIGVNLGKNRQTPLENAADDYIKCMQQIYAYSDYVVINLSSPNTPGLTELQNLEYLRPLLHKIRACRDNLAKRSPGDSRALFLKLSPDLTKEQRKLAVDEAMAAGFYGIIASNTSRRRDFDSIHSLDKNLKEEGGLSGLPLAKTAKEQIVEIRQNISKEACLISVGGLHSVEDAVERLELGANLLQMYTQFIYEGPEFPAQIAEGV